MEILKSQSSASQTVRCIKLFIIALFSIYSRSTYAECKESYCSPGTITQWGEVSKNKKDKSRAKAKETAINAPIDNGPRVPRGVHADGGRGGGRGRGTDRGRGGRGRGAAVVHTNGTHTKRTPDLSVPTEESPAWGAPMEETADAQDTTKTDSWGATAEAVATSTAEAAKTVTSSIIPDGVKKSWASMFKPAPAPKQYVAVPK
jgi:hypothetical protein